MLSKSLLQSPYCSMKRKTRSVVQQGVTVFTVQDVYDAVAEIYSSYNPQENINKYLGESWS